MSTNNTDQSGIPRPSTSSSSSSRPSTSAAARDLPQGRSPGANRWTRPTTTVQKKCNVCGDLSKSMHFGAHSCDSCKAFFRRSVQNHAYPMFVCTKGGGQCPMNMNTRKSCQHCRFQKCLDIGMETNWVMNDAERAMVQKRKQERRQELERLRQLEEEMESPEPEAREQQVTESLTMEEKSEIDLLVRKFHASYNNFPYRNHPQTPNPSVASPQQQLPVPKGSIEIIELFTTMVRRLVFFYQGQSEFNTLPIGDQWILMKGGALEICMLRSAIHYNFPSQQWSLRLPNNVAAVDSSSTNSESISSQMNYCDQDFPILQLEEMRRLVSPDLYNLHLEFIMDIQGLQVDESTIAILTNIVLFCPDREKIGNGLTAGEQVTQVQDKYLRLLKNYVNWRYGLEGGKWLYPKLLGKLTLLRQLNDFHSEFNLRLTREHVDMIREAMSNLAL